LLQHLIAGPNCYLRQRFRRLLLANLGLQELDP